MNREPILILKDILQDRMLLTDEQIFIYNQDFKIPTTQGLFVVLNYGTTQNYSTTNQFIPADEAEEGAEENISMLTKEDYIINLMSKNNEARLRKEEAIMAFNSNFSQEKQNEFQFQIARISNSFNNVSELEGAGMLNRFAITISLLAHYSQTNDTAYYDTFPKQITIKC